ncbi:MAG: hypothetical protein EA397_10880 [Deltaproteobacteria bacterium]|nr:MAG: hypothetical protein EA397_10880 [Deltaproteobacteria bacterium]
MRGSWMVLMLFATACGEDLFGGMFSLRDPSCGRHVPELARGLTFHLLQNSDYGVFEYQPEGASLVRIEGEYDFETGDFSWVETGSATSWIRRVEVEGYGYAAQNGDLDIIGERILTDELDEVEHQQFRIEREGCGVERRVRLGSGAFAREMVETGVFRTEGYTYNQETDLGDAIYKVSGTRLADQTFTEELELEQGDYVLDATRTGSVADGTSVRTFSETFEGGATRSGTNTFSTDGSSSFSFTQTTSAGTTVWDYTVDYEGNGSGTVTGSNLECDLTFEQGNCTYLCSGGQRGAC